jgi:parallel beta-helix repeat protein
MDKEIVLAAILTLLLAGITRSSMLTLALDYGWTQTIYIQADGSVSPSTAPVSSLDNLTYTLTDNIAPRYGAIVIQRDNIIIDGTHHVLQGTPSSYSPGIELEGRSNVTIENMEIMGFEAGIWLLRCSHTSIEENNISDNGYGIWLDGSNNNSVSENLFVNDGLRVDGSYGNVVSGNLVNGKPLVYLEEKSDLTVEDAGQLILVRCNNITVENLNLHNSTIGIQLLETSNSTMSNNDIEENNWVCGISLVSSSDNNIRRNNITGNEDGIDVYSSSNNNTVSGNNITANEGVGIGIFLLSSNNIVSGNEIANNGEGIYLSGTSDNTVSSNNITKNGDGVYIFVSPNSLVSGNIIKNNDDGIFFDYSSSSQVSGNNITNNAYGIAFSSYCNDNVMNGNNITNNSYGIFSYEDYSSHYFSHDNKIYHNNFVDNTKQVSLPFGVANFWDNGYPSGGNYWSDHVGVDVKSGPGQDLPGSDGICDTPYIIDSNNLDRYPLMNATRVLAVNFTWSPPMPRATRTVTFNATSPTPNTSTTVLYTWDLGDGNITTTTNPTITHYYAGSKRYNVTLTVLFTNSITKSVKIMSLADINMDGRVDIKDIAMVTAAFDSYPGHPRWNPNCDMNGDNRIDIYDVAYVASFFGWHDP